MKRQATSKAERLSYGVRESAELLGMSAHTLRRDVKAGRIKAARYGKKILISHDVLATISRKGLKIA